MPEHKKGGHCIGLDRLARMFALRPSRAPQALKQKRTFASTRFSPKNQTNELTSIRSPILQLRAHLMLSQGHRVSERGLESPENPLSGVPWRVKVSPPLPPTWLKAVRKPSVNPIPPSLLLWFATFFEVLSDAVHFFPLCSLHSSRFQQVHLFVAYSAIAAGQSPNAVHGQNG